jgi:hypothetical protein
MPFGMPVTTGRVSTGNVRTTFDLYTPAPLAATPGPTPPPFGGLACPLGTIFTDLGGSDGVSGTTTQLATGQTAVYKYVLYKSATNPALTTCAGCVYYTDNTGLIVSGTATDGYMGATTSATSSDLAGVMMLNTTDLTTVTSTILNNNGYGSAIWICIGGFCKAVCCPSTITAGDYLYGVPTTTGTAWITQRVQAHVGTVRADRLLGNALSSAAQIGATGVYTCDVQVEIGAVPY